MQAGGHRFDPDQLHQTSLGLSEQASLGSAISKLKILVSHVRERLKARAAAWQRSVI